MRRGGRDGPRGPAAADPGADWQGWGMDEGEDLTAAWGMIWVMIAFKVGLTAWIVVAFPSGQNLFMQIVMNWPWLLAAAIFLVGPSVFWWRMLRVRAKRAKLQHAEWHVDSEPIHWRR
jgi:hypothetical protein